MPWSIIMHSRSTIVAKALFGWNIMPWSRLYWQNLLDTKVFIRFYVFGRLRHQQFASAPMFIRVLAFRRDAQNCFFFQTIFVLQCSPKSILLPEYVELEMGIVIPRWHLLNLVMWNKLNSLAVITKSEGEICKQNKVGQRGGGGRSQRPAARSLSAQ